MIRERLVSFGYVIHNLWFVFTGYGAGMYYDKLEEAKKLLYFGYWGWYNNHIYLSGGWQDEKYQKEKLGTFYQNYY